MAEKSEHQRLRGINIGMGLAIGLAIGVAIYITTENWMMLLGGVGLGLGFAAVLQRHQKRKLLKEQERDGGD